MRQHQYGSQDHAARDKRILLKKEQGRQKRRLTPKKNIWKGGGQIRTLEKPLTMGRIRGGGLRKKKTEEKNLKENLHNTRKPHSKDEKIRGNLRNGSS